MPLCILEKVQGLVWILGLVFFSFPCPDSPPEGHHSSTSSMCCFPRFPNRFHLAIQAHPAAPVVGICTEAQRVIANICIQSQNWGALGFLFLTRQSKIRIVTASLLAGIKTEGLFFLSKHHVRCRFRNGAACPKGRLPAVLFLQIFAFPRDGISLTLGEQPIEGNMPMSTETLIPKNLLWL